MRGLVALGSLCLSQAQLAPAPFAATYGTTLTAAPLAASQYTTTYGTTLAAAPVVAAATYGAPVYAAPYGNGGGYVNGGGGYGNGYGNGGYGAPAAQDRSFLFNDPTLDLLAVSSLSGGKSSGAGLLPLLALSGGLDGNGGYDQFGNYQDPAKKAVLLTGLASGSVSPLTAVALDRNPGATSSDALVASALGNNPLTSLLVLNQAPGQSLTGGGNLFGNYGNNGGYNNGGLFGNSNNGVLPAIVLASAIGGHGTSGGLGTVLALSAINNNNNGYNNGYDNGYYNNGYNGGYVNGQVNGGYYNGGGYNNGGYNNGIRRTRRGARGVLSNVRNNLDDLFDGF